MASASAPLRLVRSLLFLVTFLAKVGILSPLWLVRAILHRKSPGGPNTLQLYFDHVVKHALVGMAAHQVQAGPWKSEPWAWTDRLQGRQFTFIEPARETFQDETLPRRLDAVEKSRRTAAFWYLNPKEKGQSPSRTKRARKSPCVLYCHGGAYVTLAAGDAAMGGTLAANLSKCAEVDVLTLDYRLAPGSRFPSQIFEVLSAYRHLQSLGYKRIYLGGDSAGANLVLASWRYLDHVLGEGTSIAGLLLNSPWLDLVGYETTAFQTAAHRDLIARSYVETGSKALGVANLHDPFASPIVWGDADLARLPSLYVIHGGDETLLDEGLRFVKGAQAQGVNVTHAVYDGYPHDFFSLPYYGGMSKRTFRATKAWFHLAESA